MPCFPVNDFLRRSHLLSRDFRLWSLFPTTIQYSWLRELRCPFEKENSQTRIFATLSRHRDRSAFAMTAYTGSQKQPQQPPPAQRIGRWYFGGLASAGAACCTHPLDLLKVHLQTAGSEKIGLIKQVRRLIKILHDSDHLGFYISRRARSSAIRAFWRCTTASRPRSSDS